MILVLDHGKIVSCGTHDELMQTSPIYREVYESQTKRQSPQTMPPRPNGPRLSMKESMKQLDKKTLFRLLSYMKPYRLHLVFVFICIAVSAFASVMSSLSLKSLI